MIRVGYDAPFQWRGLEHMVGNAFAVAISDGLLFGIKTQPQLLAHISRRGLDHQRLDPSRQFRLGPHGRDAGYPRSFAGLCRQTTADRRDLMVELDLKKFTAPDFTVSIRPGFWPQRPVAAMLRQHAPLVGYAIDLVWRHATS